MREQLDDYTVPNLPQSHARLATVADMISKALDLLRSLLSDSREVFFFRQIPERGSNNDDNADNDMLGF